MPALLAGTLAALAFASSAHSQIYWANRTGNTISRASLDGTVVDPGFIGGLTAPRDVAIDGRYIYWVEGNSPGSIGRATLDGTLAPNAAFPITVGDSPQGIALDTAGIYWSNTVSGVGKIGTARRDGTAPNLSFMTPASAPCGVGSDLDQVYWANTGNPGSVATQHGQFATPNQTFITATSNPCGLALTGDHIYWTNQAANSIGRATHEGADQQQDFIPLTTTTSPCGVAVDGQHIYWTTASGDIGRANLDGTGVEEHFIPQSRSGAQDPCGIAVSPTAESSPASYTFADTTVGGQSDIQAFYIADGGSSVMDVSSVAFSGADPSDFAITGDGCTGTESSAGLGCVLNVRFTPTALGDRSATIEIKSSASNSPTEVPLNGTAVEPPDTRPPKLHHGAVDPPVFAVKRGMPKGGAGGVKRGTRFSYSLSEAARVRFSFERRPTGRAVGGFTQAGTAGVNSKRWGGRIGNEPLPPARYLVTLTATDAAGNASTPLRLRFEVVRAHPG